MLAGGKPRQRFVRVCKHAHSVPYVRRLQLGWGGGDVNVHVNLRRTHMLRHGRGFGLGWGGGGVNLHVNLRHMRMLRHVRGLGLGLAVSSSWHQNSRRQRKISNSWMVYFMENPRIKWMIEGAAMSGNNFFFLQMHLM